MSYATTTQRALRYQEVCEKLGLPIEFKLIDEFKYNKQIRTNEGKPDDGKKPSVSSSSTDVPNIPKNSTIQSNPSSKSASESNSLSDFKTFTQSEYERLRTLKHLCNYSCDQLTDMIEMYHSSRFPTQS